MNEPNVAGPDLARSGAIFEGTLRHRRSVPKPRQFSHRLFMLWLDLDRLDAFMEPLRLASSKRWAPIRYRREDYFGDPSRTLSEEVRSLVAEKTGSRPEGPIRLLTQLRNWGFSFNPVSFYYCYGPDDGDLEAIVAEVHNTPWDERYCYVLHEGEVKNGVHRYDLRKDFHVSPFMPMDIDYQWKFNHPWSAGDQGRRLFVHMENFRSGQKVFDATLSLERSSRLTDRALLAVLLRYPWMPLRVVAWIYGHALVLWLKKTPFYPHPKEADVAPRSS